MSERLASLVRRFGAGDLIASSTLQEGLSTLETSYGYWAYQRVGATAVTLGGPICAPADRQRMFEQLRRKHRHLVLCYVRESLLAELDGATLHASAMGTDRHVDVDALVRAPHPQARGALKKARRAHFRLRPLDLETISPTMKSRLERIGEDYLARAECDREMRFINRPMSFAPDPMRRVFVLEKADREGEGVFGFAVQNAIFDDGHKTGYLLDILRFEKTRLWGVWLSTVCHLAERAAQEGLGLSLGFVPLHGIHRPTHHGSRLLTAQLGLMEHLLGSAHYLTRLRELKSLIPGPSLPRYIAATTRNGLACLYYLLEAMGVGFSYLFGPDLLRVLGRGLGLSKTAT